MTFIDPARLPETGHPLIDEGHVQLADLANDLYLAWQGGRTGGLGRQARAFVAALAQHFAEEEGIMDDVALASAAEHRRRHADLLAEFEALAEALEGATGMVADMMVDLFRAAERLVWEHEMVDDQDFWAHFAGQRRGDPGGLVAWGPEVAVGDADIDRQHQTLLALVNDLHAGIAGGLRRESLMGRLTGLRRFTARHFAWEERCMALVPGAQCDDHVARHAALLADLDRVLADMRAGRDESVATLFGSYVRDWLVDHIATMDRQLALALTAARGGMGEATG